MIYIYILQMSNGNYYSGMTEDVDRRFNEHTSGKSKSTCAHLPVRFIYWTKRPNYKLARKLEKYIKSIGAKKFLSKMRYDKLPEGTFTGI